MANIICEYKMDKNPQGGKIRPLWLDDGGVWQDPDNYAYIGIVKDPEVKVPDTVIKFTEKTFVERQLDVHSRHPYKKLKKDVEEPEHDPKNWIAMTDEEVEAEAKKWFKKNK